MNIRNWLLSQVDETEELEDLAYHGAASGAFGPLTYYRDTIAFYDEHEDEIWERASEMADDMGASSTLEFIASLQGARQVEDDATFKNLMAWLAAEEVAREIVEE